MSMIGDGFATVRRLMLLDSDVETLKRRADLADQRFLDQERRLTRIETLIEFGGPAPVRPSPRRLSRR